MLFLRIALGASIRDTIKAVVIRGTLKVLLEFSLGLGVI